MDAHGGANSAVAAVPKDATSYVHRDKLWLFQYVILATDAADREPYDAVDREPYAFLDRWIDAITDGMPDSDWGRYAKYIDPDLSQEDALEQYYGQHLSRLEAIKTKVDPTDLFHFPQGILPQ
ncbi:Carbohydrate oxidase like protein [Verticillium longisporum]|nr:Carbohydrate oxidase like protein [Verticillium longisporum]